MMFLLLKMERGRIFRDDFKVDKILCVETFLLILKRGRGHPFHHYFLAEIILHFETLN